jgi:hypothetical protein
MKGLDDIALRQIIALQISAWGYTKHEVYEEKILNRALLLNTCVKSVLHGKDFF